VFDFEKDKEVRVANKANIGSFYRCVNKRLTSSSGVGPLRSPTGALTTDDCDKATLLNDYFGSVFTNDDGA